MQSLLLQQISVTLSQLDSRLRNHDAVEPWRLERYGELLRHQTAEILRRPELLNPRATLVWVLPNGGREGAGGEEVLLRRSFEAANHCLHRLRLALLGEGSPSASFTAGGEALARDTLPQLAALVDDPDRGQARRLLARGPLNGSDRGTPASLATLGLRMALIVVCIRSLRSRTRAESREI